MRKAKNLARANDFVAITFTLYICSYNRCAAIQQYRSVSGSWDSQACIVRSKDFVLVDITC
jgi:hypothetical protein